MNLKSIIRRSVPTALYRAARNAKVGIAGGGGESSSALRPQSFSPRASFAEAKQEAGIGYGGMVAPAHIGNVWLIEMQDYAAPMLASVALAARRNRPIRVLDFGGGTGFFRGYVRDFFNDRIQTEWRVVETEEQVAINQNLPGSDFVFSTEIGSDNYDLAIFSGSLHCIDDWKAALRQTNADLVFIARLPLGEVEQSYLQTVIQGENINRFAGRVVSKSELFELLSVTHDLFARWPFSAHLLQMGVFDAPAMLWRKKGWSAA